MCDDSIVPAPKVPLEEKTPIKKLTIGFYTSAQKNIKPST
jgi:hypothetical protein